MKTASNALRRIESGLLLLGVLLVVMFAIAHIHRFIMLRCEMARFEARQRESAKDRDAGEKAVVSSNRNRDLYQTQNTDYSLWSAQRTKLHQATLTKRVEPLAVLRIPALHLEVPLLEGTDELTLNRGVGRITGTSHPGQGGNIGIAGHRDGFFRGLKDIRNGNKVELVTESGTDVYVVDRIRITNPDDVGVLQPRTNDSLTLVTCYPFYFVGPAPKRYVVEASMEQRAAQDEEPGSFLLEGENQ